MANPLSRRTRTQEPAESAIEAALGSFMLSLPSKPWKKVKIAQLGEQEYRITFVSPLESETQFLEAVEEDLGASTGEGDRLGQPDWASRSVTLTTADLAAFKRKLVYASIMIEAA